MTSPEYSPDKQYRMLMIIAITMLIAAPPVYWLIANLVSAESMVPRPFNLFTLYILLIIGVLQPAMAPLIEKMRLSGNRGKLASSGSAAALVVSTSITKLALIEAIYIYGFIIFILSGKLVYMLYFYPIGIVWSAVLWPRRKKFDRLVRDCEGS